MKKLTTALLILIFLFSALSLSPSIPAGSKNGGVFSVSKALAEGNDTGDAGVSGDPIATDIFLPTSYLQYYKLDNPYAICRYEDDGDTFVAISHAGAIVIYKCSGETGSEQFRSIKIDGSSAIGVPSIAKYKNFLIFTQWSNIYYIDVSDFDSAGDRPQVSAGLSCSYGFSVYGDMIAVTTNSAVIYYDLSVAEDGSLAFTQKSENKYCYEITGLTAIYLADNEKTFFHSNDAKAIFEYSPVNSVARKIVTGVENVKSLAQSKETGNELFYSTSEGLFSVNPSDSTPETTEICRVSEEGERDLGKLWNPQGLCVVDGKLWVVDSDNSDPKNSINAVQEFDLDKGKFTDFAITTNSKAVNRLTGKAQDITMYGDNIYALDEDRIVVIGNADDVPENRTYHRIDLESSVDEFAVYGDYVAYSTFNSTNLTSKITVAKITAADDENPILGLEKIFDSSENLSSIQIRDIACMDGVFYFIGSQLNHPVLFSLDTASSSPGLVQAARFDDIDGAATNLAVDPFNSLYFSVKIPGGSGYDVYKYENGVKSHMVRVPVSKNLLSMQTDLDGKIYLLYENNLTECYNGAEKVFSRTLETSGNLGTIKPATAMCAGCDSAYAYFIFEGLILRSSAHANLGISTPYTIDIPSDFSFDYSKNETYGKLRTGAKLFEIKASELSSEFFAFEKFAIEDGENSYAVKDLGGKYYLVINDNHAAIARKTDFIETSAFGVTPLEKTAYAMTDFRTYGLPALRKVYAAAATAKKYDKIAITGELNFNGDDYYVVKIGDAEGFIPKTFVAENYLSETEYAALGNAYVYAKNGATVYAEDLTTVTDEITSYKQVILLSVSGDYAKIVYDGKIGYVKNDLIVKNSKRNAVKAAAMIILALSLFVTTYYFEKRYLLKSE